MYFGAFKTMVKLILGKQHAALDAISVPKMYQMTFLNYLNNVLFIIIKLL